jgi:peptidoglycan/LPS O-acetylase OafA/YrhL
MAATTQKHIPGLDGIRAIAFMMVYFSHMEFGRSFVGGDGVAIFFCLSGYLITTLVRREAEATGAISIKAFYIRRIFRIFPTLYITLLLAILLHFANLNPSLNLPALSSVLFYYSNFFMINHGGHGGMGGLAVTWSLSVEEHFYLIFPFIFAMICRMSRKAQATVLGAICVLCFFWRCVLGYGMHVEKYRTYLGTDTRFDAILMGSILALSLNPLFDRLPSWFRGRPRQFAIAGLIVALTIDHIPVVNRGVSFTIQGLALFPVFWYVILHCQDRGIQWLESPQLRIIGRWSYSLYLVHQIFITAVQLATGLNGPISASLAIAPCLAYAWAVEKFIEKPSYNLRNLILSKTSTVSPPKMPVSRVAPRYSASDGAPILTQTLPDRSPESISYRAPGGPPM